ncbi:MAG: hypothetical protein ACSHWZ_06550 [Sulfitobacter sp.]
MARRPHNVFLERRSYRARRIMDAVRLLPIMGAALWMVPLLWTISANPETPGTTLSQALRYIFAVWWVLIGLSLWLWSMARRADGRGETPRSEVD